MKKLFLILLIAFSCLVFYPLKNAFADEFTVTLPGGSAVTMGDSTATLPFTVTNNGPGQIRDIIFTINTAIYNFSSATVPPTGWCIKTISAGSIEFALTQGGGSCSSGANGYEITPSTGKIFNITLTGPGGGAILAAAADVNTDTLSGVTVSVQGGFTLSGGLPVWSRKALAISLSAAPSSCGVGDTITVTMNVTNRSTASQGGITGSPNPPGRTYTGGASVTLIGSAVYGTSSNPPVTTLTSNINASVTTIPVSSTTGYPASGRIMIDNELLDYTGITATSFTGVTRGVGGTTAATHDNGTLVYSQNTNPFTLAAGETGSIKWSFSADTTGTVYFTSAGRNSGGTATSKSENSNTVVIGTFTATLTVFPLSVVSGQTVTVRMTVSNNGTSTLNNITPTLTPQGTATKSLSAPTPASFSLSSGSSGTFEWVCTITGTAGQTYYFTGSATSGAQTTNTATSETGTLNQYSVTPTPGVVVTGVGSSTFTWTVYNRGGATVREVAISIPSPTGNCASTSGWGYASNTPPANWTAATSGAPVNLVTFTTSNPVDTYGIPVGGSKSFSITFNCVPQVTSDTDYTFSVLITDKNSNQSMINTTITVTAYSLTLTVYDDDCNTIPAPPSKPANGDSRYCLKALLTSGGSGVPDQTVTFTIIAGSGSIYPSSGTAMTNGSGVATVFIISPCSTTPVNTTVKAAYTVDTYDAKTVQFDGVGGSSLSYVDNSLTFFRNNPLPAGFISPDSISTGDNGFFRLDLRNCGDTAITIQTTNTSLAIRQNSADTFALNGNVTINPFGASASLTFATGTIASGTLQCTPYLIVNDIAGTYTGTYAFNKAPAGDLLPIPGDTVTVNGGTTCPPPHVRILDWREVIN